MNDRFKSIFGVFIFGGMLADVRKSGIYEIIKRVWGHPTHNIKLKTAIALS